MSFNIKRHIFHSDKFKSVVEETLIFFDKTSGYSLPPSIQFIGQGVYALYYNGDFKHYRDYVRKQSKSRPLPIYVGKAVPPGWRAARIFVSESNSLYMRLREHSRSITQAKNLNLQDFSCRFIVLINIESDLIVPVEAELIRKYRPLWNMYVDGFGNHDPGKGRYNQAKSEWDVMHPGRPWSDRLTGQPPKIENILRKINIYTERI